MKLDKDTHVYCTKCKHGEELIKAITAETEMPLPCQSCNPWNCEDSMRFEDRPNYKPSKATKFDTLQIDSVSFWGEHELNKGGMRIFWSGCMGWGTLDIVKNKGSNLNKANEEYEEMELLAYTECMDTQEEKMFIKKIMELLVDKLIVVE